mgnify:CR=1 FL=1
MDTLVEKAILDEVHQLKIDEQKKVLEYARSLSAASSKGVMGKDLLRFAGSIDKEDLLKMSQAIEDDCERINSDEW